MKLRQDQKERLDRLATACAPRAWRLAYSWTRNQQDAEDAVQQAFVVAATKVDQLPSDPWPWFAVVVSNEARNLVRKLSNRRRLQEKMNIHPEMNVDESASLALDENQSKALADALDDVPDDEREAIYLTFIGELSTRAAAQRLNVSHDTVARRVRAGIARLKQVLGSDEATVSRSLSMLPIPMPAMGMETATKAWVSVAKGTLASNSGSGGALSLASGGSIMAKKTAVALGLACALSVGFVGGKFLELGSDAQDENDPIGAFAPDPALEGGSISSERESLLQKELNTYKQKLDALDRKHRQLRDEYDATSPVIADLEAEKESLKRQLQNAEERLAHALGGKAVESKPEIEGRPAIIEVDNLTNKERTSLRSINWAKLAQASQLVDRFSSNEPSTSEEAKSLHAAREVVSNQMKILDGALSARTVDGVKRSGHIAYLLNLMAARLNEVGEPLNSRQVETFVAVASDYVEAIKGIDAGVDDSRFVVKEALQRLEHGVAHMKRAKEVLTPEQRDVLFDVSTEGTIADSLSPLYFELDRYSVIDCDEADAREEFDESVSDVFGEVSNEVWESIPPDILETWWRAGVGVSTTPRSALQESDVIVSLRAQVEATTDFLDRVQIDADVTKLVKGIRHMVLFTRIAR